MQFLIAVRQQLGLGLSGLCAPLSSTTLTCTACRNQAPLNDGGFHVLYSCPSHRASRNHRHAGVQRACENLAKLTNMQVSQYAPNVTPRAPANAQSQTTQRTGKQEFGDWSVTDPTTGTTLVLDNTVSCPFTDEARKLGQQQRKSGEPKRWGHSAHYALAEDRRRTKFVRKHQGCVARGQLFLPFVNLSNGAFVPQDPTTLQVHTNAATKFFGAPLAGNLGRTGARPRSVEEGLIRRWSRRACDTENGGKGVYDATLSLDRAAGLLTMHTYRVIAHSAIRCSAAAALHAIRFNTAITLQC